MTTPVENSGNPEAQKLEAQVEKTIQEIEQQEKKVEKAEGTPSEVKEKDRLGELIEKFDGLTERLGKIEERLAEPTVPAPEAKKEEAPVESEGGKDPAAPVDAPAPPKPGKRRLGAW